MPECGHGTPAVGHRVLRRSGSRLLRVRKGLVQTDKTFPVGIKTVGRPGTVIEGEMIPSLAVLGFMNDGGTVNFDLADIQVPLKILTVGLAVPESEFHVRIERKLTWFLTLFLKITFWTSAFSPRGTVKSMEASSPS